VEKEQGTAATDWRCPIAWCGRD